MKVYKDVFSNGSIYHYNEKGQLHREDGPAVESYTGYKDWRINDEYHRTDGPAREWISGRKEWWLNGKLHRLDGPAIENCDGYNTWYIDGKRLTEQQFNNKLYVILYT